MTFTITCKRCGDRTVQTETGVIEICPCCFVVQQIGDKIAENQLERECAEVGGDCSSGTPTTAKSCEALRTMSSRLAV
jgi:hypothetical protein